MYLPAHFNECRPDALHALIRENPLGILVTHGQTGLDADHIPFEFSPDAGPHGTLSAHVARSNPLWQRHGDGADVLVIFRGAQGYISPSWYPSKHQTHRQVPTWNYEVVHAHGRLSIHDDERYVRRLVARLTTRHERAEPTPWRMGDAPRDYLDDMLSQIVGIEIAITTLTGKRKLSQNKAPKDRLSAADALAARGMTALAQAMRDVD